MFEINTNEYSRMYMIISYFLLSSNIAILRSLKSNEDRKNRKKSKSTDFEGLDQRFSTDGSRPGNGSWKISNGSWLDYYRYFFVESRINLALK